MKRRKNQSRSGGHRIVPVWNESFDLDGFARALLLLAMHLDENEQVVHTSENAEQSAKKGGEGHE